jgi:carboxyl-terminal processing protease
MKQNKTVTKVVLTFFLLVIFFLGGFYLGRIDLRPGTTGNSANGYTLSGDIKSTKDNVNVNLLWEVWSLIDQGYLKKNLDGQQLLYGAVKGLVNGLKDPYSAFLTPAETTDYQSSNAGEFEGIGTTLKQDGDYVSIESPVDGAPAQKAGLLAGDVILKVDGVSMQKLSVYEVASKIRGKAGTDVKLTIFRPSTNKQLELSITRQKINIDNVTVSKIEDGIYKIKIFKFTEESVEVFNQEWDKAVIEVKANNAKGVVIDLRNNPGGYVNSVEYVLGDLLKNGTLIFSEQDRDGNKVDHKVTRDGRLVNMPIVVLVNQGSASASEIFSGAIQDNGRGAIIGMQTVGKGVEQRLIPLSDGSTLQMVFQRWLTPDGKNISPESPIKPDTSIDDYDKQDQEALAQLKTKL